MLLFQNKLRSFTSAFLFFLFYSVSVLAQVPANPVKESTAVPLFFLDGKEILFEYENTVRFDGVYFFLEVQSNDIGRIRESFGLTYYAHIFTCFHISVGNIKDRTCYTTNVMNK